VGGSGSGSAIADLLMGHKQCDAQGVSLVDNFNTSL